MDEEANPHLVDEGVTPEQSVQQDELRALLDRTMTKLSDEYRMTLLLVDRMGLSYQEASEALEVPLGTIKSRLARARRQMQQLLQEERELLPPRYRLKDSH
jgi:RNA polymerase sigma-70 factor (ECF subfamily)